jgi:hypothetical protein
MTAKPFADLVKELVSFSRVTSIGIEVSNSVANCRRFSILLSAPTSAIDKFHNSATGYRAQYFEGTRVGDLANRFAVDAFLPSIVGESVKGGKNGIDVQLLRECLLSERTKIWIKEGTWWRCCRKNERVLLVPRWQEFLNAEDPDARKRARWGSLAPMSEHRIVIKGPWLVNDRPAPVGKDPVVRANNLHLQGFT